AVVPMIQNGHNWGTTIPLLLLRSWMNWPSATLGGVIKLIALFGGPYRKRDKEMSRWKGIAAAAMVAVAALNIGGTGWAKPTFAVTPTGHRGVWCLVEGTAETYTKCKAAKPGLRTVVIAKMHVIWKYPDKASTLAWVIEAKPFFPDPDN